MDFGPLETYHHRKITDLGIWEREAVKFKVYGLLATNKLITSDMSVTAECFIDDEVLNRIEEMGDSNGLGFIIIHPGDVGLSISAHWWVQGCVLCQHIYRREYGADDSMDTISRPVVACVWELEIVNAEQTSWQRTMMTATPNHSAYLDTRPTEENN